MKISSPRFHFALVVLVTLFLLIGSTILQQLVFRADQETATLALSPTTFRATEGGTVDFDVKNNSADTVFATGVQLELGVDQAKLEFTEAIPMVGWRTLLLQQEAGKIYWIIAPESTKPGVTELQDNDTIGRVRFRAIAAGTANVNLGQQGTILAAVDPAQGNFVYNAAVTVQSSAGTVSSVSEANLDFPETAAESLTAPEATNEPLFGAQRISSVYAAATSRDALVFISLVYPGRASVEFGQTPQLGNVVGSVGESTSHVLRLASLESGGQYFYRVIGEQAGEQSRVVGVTRSISLPTASQGKPVSVKKSEVIAFPNKTTRASSVYVFPRDDAGSAVLESAVSLPTPENVSAASGKNQAGYWQFDVTGAVSKKEVVTLRPQLDDGTLFSSSSIIFDPNYSPVQRVVSVQELVLAWNQKTINFMLGAAVLLFLLGILFVRLVRSR